MQSEAATGMTTAPARLAILVSTMGGGGAQRSMLRLAGALAQRGYAVDLVLGRAGGHYETELSAGVRVVHLHARRLLLGVPALARYLRRERPVALLTCLDYVNIVGLWARRLAGVRVRVVVNEQNTLSMAVRNSSRWRTRMMPWLIRRFYPWADGVVAVSKGVADDLAAATGLPRARVQVIHNPVVTPLMRRMAAEPLEHPWFRPGEPPVILALGRLVPQKDFGMLIRAFARVRRARAARLLILGEGPERDGLAAAIAENGLQDDVQLPGWIVNPYPYMVRSRLFVLSSRWEGLPTVLIEALFCGVEVVSTDCPSGPREILDGGQYGALVPVADVDELAEAMERALSRDPARPRQESWLPFEQDVVAGRYLQTLVGT